MEKGTKNWLLLVDLVICCIMKSCRVHILIIDINTSNTGMLRVPLNVGNECCVLSGKCQGILQCLESGHPVYEVIL